MIQGRRPGSRSIDSVHLREYAKPGETTLERVTAFLQDTDGATRADISGATGMAWATVHKVLAGLLQEGHLSIESSATPEVYRWRE